MDPNDPYGFTTGIFCPLPPLLWADKDDACRYEDGGHIFFPSLSLFSLFYDQVPRNYIRECIPKALEP